MESVWFLHDPTAGARPFVDPVWVFLAPSRLATRTKVFAIGFPWISLDFLVRIDIYQWVTRDSQERIFSRALVVAQVSLKRQPTIRHAKRTDCSWAKLILISDFLQQIAIDRNFRPSLRTASIQKQSLSCGAQHHRVGRLDRASKRDRRILDKALDHPTPSIGSGSSPLARRPRPGDHLIARAMGPLAIALKSEVASPRSRRTARKFEDLLLLPTSRPCLTLSSRYIACSRIASGPRSHRLAV
jgi:hypothetical protein